MKCYCDARMFPTCPGHGPTGLKGLRTRAKPVGKPANVQRAERWARHLRPYSTEEEVVKHAASKKRWAVCLWHFGEEGGDDEQVEPGRSKTVANSPCLSTSY